MILRFYDFAIKMEKSENLSIKHKLNIKYMLCINELLMILSVNARHSALKRAAIWEDRLNSSPRI